MARTGMLLLLLAHFVTSALLINVTQIKVYPERGTVYGVFQASLSSGYSFNAYVGREVCDRLGVVMADKAQVELALRRGFETCKFGWIDEQVAVIPRIHSKDSCGQGKVGIITWRTSLDRLFDVFCFNSTDCEAQVDMWHETHSSTVTPAALTSRGHPKWAKTTRPASRDNLRSASSSVPVSENDTPESQAFSNTSSTSAGLVVLIVSLMTLFGLLLLSVFCYYKKYIVGQWNKSHQKENMETKSCGKTGKEEPQAEFKKQYKSTSNTNDVSVTIKAENKNEAAP
ncbi:lymphatic vessel endothelial hyaluronic acid receptor 1a [Clarias gariepinus]